MVDYSYDSFIFKFGKIKIDYLDKIETLLDLLEYINNKANLSNSHSSEINGSLLFKGMPNNKNFKIVKNVENVEKKFLVIQRVSEVENVKYFKEYQLPHKFTTVFKSLKNFLISIRYNEKKNFFRSFTDLNYMRYLSEKYAIIQIDFEKIRLLLIDIETFHLYFLFNFIFNCKTDKAKPFLDELQEFDFDLYFYICLAVEMEILDFNLVTQKISYERFENRIHKSIFSIFTSTRGLNKVIYITPQLFEDYNLLYFLENFLEENSVKFVYSLSENNSDLEKSIEYLRSFRYSSILVYNSDSSRSFKEILFSVKINEFASIEIYRTFIKQFFLYNENIGRNDNFYVMKNKKFTITDLKKIYFNQFAIKFDEDATFFNLPFSIFTKDLIFELLRGNFLDTNLLINSLGKNKINLPPNLAMISPSSVETKKNFLIFRFENNNSIPFICNSKKTQIKINFKEFDKNFLDFIFYFDKTLKSILSLNPLLKSLDKKLIIELNVMEILLIHLMSNKKNFFNIFNCIKIENQLNIPPDAKTLNLIRSSCCLSNNIKLTIINNISFRFDPNRKACYIVMNKKCHFLENYHIYFDYVSLLYQNFIFDYLYIDFRIISSLKSNKLYKKFLTSTSLSNKKIKEIILFCGDSSLISNKEIYSDFFSMINNKSLQLTLILDFSEKYQNKIENQSEAFVKYVENYSIKVLCDNSALKFYTSIDNHVPNKIVNCFIYNEEKNSYYFNNTSITLQGWQNMNLFWIPFHDSIKSIRNKKFPDIEKYFFHRNEMSNYVCYSYEIGEKSYEQRYSYLFVNSLHPTLRKMKKNITQNIIKFLNSRYIIKNYQYLKTTGNSI